MNQVVDFCKKQGMNLAIALVIVSLLCIFWSGNKKNKLSAEKEDCLRLQTLCAQMETSQNLSSTAIDEIDEIVSKHPFLTPKYETFLSLARLSQKQEEKALAHMISLIEQHKEVDAKIQKFNEISVLLTQKEYNKASDELRDLNTLLEQDKSYPTLYVCNLLRTLIVAEKNHDPLLAKVTWDKLVAHPSWHELEPIFQEKTLVLKDYLAQTLPL